MDALDLLRHQTHYLYRSISSALGDVDFAGARFSLGSQPSIAWQAGHVLENADSTAAAVAGIEREVKDLRDERDWGCTCDRDWQDLRERWDRRSAACLTALDQLAPADLDQPPAIEVLPGFENMLSDRRRFWSGHVFHMGYHLGQIGSLRAELGLGWWKT